MYLLTNSAVNLNASNGEMQLSWRSGRHSTIVLWVNRVNLPESTIDRKKQRVRFGSAGVPRSAKSRAVRFENKTARCFVP